MKNEFISSVWNFNQTTLDEPKLKIHDIYRWYGKLVPQLVSRLIKLYSKEEDLVLANFSGCGTVLVESDILNRRSVGIDSNPLAVLISKVKTTPYIPNTKKFLKELQEFAEDRDEKYPMDDEDRKWFDEQVFQNLMKIKNKIDIDIKNEKDRNYYLLALASIVRRVSRVDSRCVNHIVVDKSKPVVDVFTEFKKKIKEIDRSMEEYLKFNPNSKAKVYEGDARNLNIIDDNSVDLIISHPPYLGCIHYSNIVKLSNKILGYDYNEVKKNDISTNSLQKYMKDMKRVFDEMKRVLKPQKYACIIIGDNRHNGYIVPTFSYFVNYAEEIGFKLRDIFIWVTNQKAGMNVKRRGNYIDHNYILIFHKPDQ